MKEVEILKLIRTNLLRRGNGKDDPIRIIEQYWDIDGNLVFEIDPVRDGVRGSTVNESKQVFPREKEGIE